MHGDFSRRTFDPADGYRAVLLQQGRVLLDAEVNEQADIVAHHDEVRTRDLVGPAGGPASDADGPGPFAVVATDDSGAAVAGRPENVAWNRLRLTPGTYYVDGVLCECVTAEEIDDPVGWPLDAQPMTPRTRHADERAARPMLEEPDGDRYVLYLDAWTRQVTGDEDPSLLEPALGPGADTATRARTVWQVRAYAPEWQPPDLPTMTAALNSADGAYHRLENQLYRVQVHQGGEQATVIWSRDNGSVVARLRDLVPGDPATLTVDRNGRDDDTAFVAGGLVEVTSADRELHGEPGFLAHLRAAPAAQPDGGSVTLLVGWVREPATLADLGLGPIVRRWDCADPLRVADQPLEIDDDIQITFPHDRQASLRPGDYWLIPARTVRLPYGLGAEGGTIEWPAPADAGGVPQPQALPKVGPRHHLAPLAVLRRDTDGWTVQDRRQLFATATVLTALAHPALDLIGGDGQSAVPGTALAAPIRVIVRTGGRAVAGARVTFTGASGHLAVDGPPDQSAPTALPALVTDDSGILDVRWLLDPGGPPTQTMTATLVDADGRAIGGEVLVTGHLDHAGAVAWTPTCGRFADTTTVQDALNRLAGTTELRLLGGDGQQVGSIDGIAPHPVRVLVDSPCGPVAGARVEATPSGSGRVLPVGPATDPPPWPLPEPGPTGPPPGETGADGAAAFWWQPGAEASATLTLRLPGAAAAPVVVTATRGPAAADGLHITGVRFGTGSPFGNDTAVRATDLLSGITVTLDGPADPGTVRGKPVLRVSLDLPWPAGENAVGVHAVEIAAGPCDADGDALTWPGPEDPGGYAQRLFALLTEQRWTRPLSGRFLLDGWAVASAAAEGRPPGAVNTHARPAVRADGGTDLVLPTDDQVAGGTYVQWFTVGAAVPEVVGLSHDEAERLLEDRRLRAVKRWYPGSAPAGQVTDSDPAAGSYVDVDTLVTIGVSDGTQVPQ